MNRKATPELGAMRFVCLSAREILKTVASQLKG
jgi:hypothetical protein